MKLTMKRQSDGLWLCKQTGKLWEYDRMINLELSGLFTLELHY